MDRLTIFDLDGTLSDCAHRQYLLDRSPREWNTWNALSWMDTPFPHMQFLFGLLQASGHTAIWSGRCQGRNGEIMEWTIDWLRKHYDMSDSVSLRMRPHLDHREDDVLKQEWLDELLAINPDRSRLLVFEDRDRMVRMWRRNGIACLQVADGNF